MRRVYWAVLVVCLLLWMQPSVCRAVGFGKNKVQTRDLQWQVLNTPHLRIHYYDGAEELAVRAALIGERAYKEYADRLDMDLPWMVPFILYSSHNDFSQTNISDALIGEGTGGFSEPLRNRVVLPYNGNHEDFVHVIRHELVHAFMFQMAFGKGGTVARARLFHIPLWFAEGIAEWLSSGWDAEADLYIRDATINDYLYPLDRVGGFMVYKQGQAAMRLLVERYGPAKLAYFWRQVGRQRSVDKALEKVYGLTLEDFNRLFRKEMRRRYWPRYSELEGVQDIARALTDHRKQGTFLNDMPALNPAGDQLVCFSDREGLVDLWLISALDGRAIRRLGQGQRSGTFESFHGFRTGPCFAPDGREVAVVAKSGNRETLHTIDVESGDVTRSLALGLDVILSPAWSPDGTSILVAGTVRGRTDLYRVDLDGRAADTTVGVGEPIPLDDGATMIRLTDDVGDEATPAWSPDGHRVLFVHNPLAEIEYQFEVQDDGTRRLQWARPVAVDEVEALRTAAGGEVHLLDLNTGQRSTLFDRSAGVREPVWLDQTTLAAIRRTGGIDNLILAELTAADSDTVQVRSVRRLTNLLGGISHLSWSRRADRLVFSAFNAAGYDIYAADHFVSDWVGRRPSGPSAEPVTATLPELVERDSAAEPPLAPENIGLVEDYRATLNLDLSQALGGGAVYFNPDVGLGMANVISLSDLLGDHRMRFLVNFYGSLENSDLALSYTYLKRRLDYGGGLFHYSNYYNSVFTGVGELLSRQTRFRERNYGLYGFASYPLDTFRRFDFELQYLNSERTELDYVNGTYISTEGQRTLRRMIQPTLSYTYDTALYGLHGPVTGTRWVVSASQTLTPSRSSVSRFTSLFDYRKYWMPWSGNSFAVHLSFAVSDGDDPRGFVLGGPWTLRGYNYYDFQTVENLSGTKMALVSLEYRLPLVDYLVFGWPGQWGFSGIGATMYVDMGSAWTDKVRFFGHNAAGSWGLEELNGNFGIGLRANIFFLPMKLDWAWKTDLRQVQSGIFQFSVGPEF